MPRIGVIGIIAFGVLIALISSFEPPREGQMSSTEYIGAIAFLALLFYFSVLHFYLSMQLNVMHSRLN